LTTNLAFKIVLKEKLMLYRRFWLLDALLIAFISTSAGNRKLIGEHLPSKSVAKQKQEYESL
jgi:hypothetical protein